MKTKEFFASGLVLVTIGSAILTKFVIKYTVKGVVKTFTVVFSPVKKSLKIRQNLVMAIGWIQINFLVKTQKDVFLASFFYFFKKF
jgi:hypothetical protein